MGRNGVPAMDQRKDDVAFECGKMVMDLLKRDLRPRQIITRKSLENAIAAVATTGGSTNAVLHLLAIAREANIKLSIDDFDKINRKVPLLADLKPGGRFYSRRPLCSWRDHLSRQAAARCRSVTRGSTDRDRPNDRRRGQDGPGNIRAASPQTSVESDQADWRARDSRRKSCSRGLRREGGRALDHDVSRPGKGL